jgi:hypothetical protein
MSDLQLTNRQVVWAYKRLLGRPPEVQSIIDDWVAKRCTLDDLIDKITASDEFKINTLGRAIHDAKQRAWLRFNQSFIFKTVAAAFVGCLLGGAAGAVAAIYLIRAKPELLAGLF